MKICLVSSGPSAKDVNPSDNDYDLIVAVNWACLLPFHAHYYCLNDAIVFKQLKNPPRLGIYAHKLAWEVKLQPWAARYRNLQQFKYLEPYATDFTTTFPMALATILCDFEPDSVDIHGLDLKGENDWKYQWGSNRKEGRWEMELGFLRPIWAPSINLINSKMENEYREALTKAGQINGMWYHSTTRP